MQPGAQQSNQKSTSILPNGPLAGAWSAVNRLLGWGDAVPGGVWFVGLEQQKEWSEEDIRSVNVSAEYLFLPVDKAGRVEGRSGATIRRMTARIASSVSTEYQRVDCELRTIEYAKRLWWAGSKLCQANLFPLGKSSFDEWPPNYAEWFGFTSAADFRNCVRPMRYPILRNAFSDLEPQAVVCFGADCWAEFRDAFDVREGSLLCVEESPRGSTSIRARFYRRGSSTFVHCPFLARPMTIDLARKIGNRLFALGVRLP